MVEIFLEAPLELRIIISATLFCGVKLRGNETFDELLKIEKDNQERIKRDEANIQRVDAQVKGVKKW